MDLQTEYTPISYPDVGTVFYAFYGAGGYSEQAVSFDNESLNSIFSTESVGTAVLSNMHLRFLLCIRMGFRRQLIPWAMGKVASFSHLPIDDDLRSCYDSVKYLSG